MRKKEVLLIALGVYLLIMAVVGMCYLPTLVDHHLNNAFGVYHDAYSGQYVEAGALEGEGPRGISGWFFTALYLLKWLCISFILVVLASFIYLVLISFGVLAKLGEKMANGISHMAGRVKEKVQPTVPLSTPVGSSGMTLGTLLQVMKQSIKENQQAIDQLKLLTAGLTPPPPPKSPEELLKEQEAQIAALQEQLKRSKNKKTVTQPVVSTPEVL